MEEISPSGTTPIARSLEECGGDFPKSQARNIIILITDGIEECNGDPCAVSASSNNLNASEIILMLLTKHNSEMRSIL
ncbi:MAG: hypothetical protein IPO63_11975 [Bacteroidetes bacterium]|nr:hypothetical protein [Bacteroidota bacterium]